MKAYVIYGQEFDRQEARWTRQPQRAFTNYAEALEIAERRSTVNWSTQIPAALLVEQVELTQEEFDRIEAKEVERKRRLQEDARRRAWRRR